jgi:pSer/pThr/pTyr-binding forkhead associated (FHA) protein
MICVLDVIEGPASGKRIWLRENQVLELGRISTADLSIPADSHMSRRHLMLESSPHGFRVRDVGSSNGTFVNNARVSAVELKTGDMIRAGMTVLSVSIKNNGENPHDGDGVSFSQSASSQSIASNAPERPERSGTIRSLEGLEKHDSETFDSEATVRLQAKELANNAASSDNLRQSPTEILQGRYVWWKSHFQPTSVMGVFDQNRLLEVDEGNFVGLVLEFSKEIQIVAIVNQSQLEPVGVAFLKNLYDQGAIETFSWSLCMVNSNDRMVLIELVKHCQGKDALIVFGSHVRQGVAELKPFANSLSYPSMFTKHIKDQEASLRRALLKMGVMALFEVDQDGKIGLLIDS